LKITAAEEDFDIGEMKRQLRSATPHRAALDWRFHRRNDWVEKEVCHSSTHSA